MQCSLYLRVICGRTTALDVVVPLDCCCCVLQQSTAQCQKKERMRRILIPSIPQTALLASVDAPSCPVSPFTSGEGLKGCSSSKRLMARGKKSIHKSKSIHRINIDPLLFSSLWTDVRMPLSSPLSLSLSHRVLFVVQYTNTHTPYLHQPFPSL